MIAPRIQRGREAHRQRGAALLTAMVSIAVLTAMAVDLAYSSRVSLQIAGNARDELRAEYLARSGVAMGRLVLSFQQTLDQTMGQAPTLPRVQLWNLVPVDRSLTDALFAGASAGAASPAAPPARGASRPTFDARIDDEARKVNANFAGYVMGADQLVRQQVQSMYQLMCDARWDPLFDREDATGQRFTREDILVRLRDWVDPNETTSRLGLAGGSNTQCGLVIGQPPFVDDFGDENQLYDRGEHRYRAKNAPMDSLDELYLVAGIGDAFMAAFGDSLTVYLRSGDKRNVNVQDPDALTALAREMADPPGQPALLDPELGSRLAKAVQQLTSGGIVSMTAPQLGALVAAAGVTVNQNLLGGPNSPFTDRSKVFRIRATGKVGAVRSSIDAVVRLEDQKAAGEQLAQPGRIVHWRED